MVLQFDGTTMSVGSVKVVTTSNGGRPPEFFAERIMDRLMYVGDNIPEPLKEQVLSYQVQMHQIILAGIKAAIESDRIYRK
jgi:hypothetical protein